VRTAFTTAATLYGLVAILLAASLPARVPVGVGTDLTADRTTSRGQLMLVVCVLGMLLVAVFAGLATQVTRASTDLWHVGAVTLLFLTAELALVYGRLGGAAAVVTGAEPAATQRLDPWTVVLLAGYLAYVLGWLAWVLTGRGRVRTGPRRAAVRTGTADSVV
jgi:hypothetical protein